MIISAYSCEHGVVSIACNIIVFIFKKTTLQIVSRGFTQSLDILTEVFVYFLELFESGGKILIWKVLKLN